MTAGKTVPVPTAEWLRRHAADAPDRVAVCCAARQITYRQLLDEALALARTLAPGQRFVLLRDTQDAHFIVRYLAAHLAGKVAVPIDAAMPGAAADRIKSLTCAARVPHGVADVLFTTGTTGQPKGVMESHRAIAADAENLVEAQGYHAGLTFVASGPLSHIGTLSKVWPTLLAGGTLHVTKGMKDADALLRAFETAPGRAATFLVPASIRILLALDRRRLSAAAHKVEFVETGAAPMTAADMRLLRETLPQSRLYNTYASTETGIIATHDYSTGECVPGCLGRPMRHSRFFTTPDGRVACQGPTLMTGYLADDLLTASVLRDGILYTGDTGHIDASGRLHLEGRHDDVINVGGYKVQPSEVENAAMAAGGLKECVCVACAHPIVGAALKLIAVPDGTVPFDARRLARHLGAVLEPYKVPSRYEQAEAVARTYNGKIDRKHYRNT